MAYILGDCRQSFCFFKHLLSTPYLIYFYSRVPSAKCSSYKTKSLEFFAIFQIEVTG